MTPDQVRGTIGGLAHNGEPGGTNVIHVYQNKNVPFMKNQFLDFYNIWDYKSHCNGVIVESHSLIHQ
jgi:hypothetical protein